MMSTATARRAGFRTRESMTVGLETLERFAEGDVDAFESLFRQHQGEVYRWIARLLRNPAVAEDLTVETFWRAWRHRRRFDPGRPLLPWLRRIATHVALDYLKSGDGRETEYRLPEFAHPSPDPAIAAERRGQIARAFYALPPRLRVAAQLALVEQCSYQEIADVLDISLSAVKMRVARAVERLRKNLDRMGIRP